MCKHKNYIPLHGHSTFSIGDGICKIDDLIEKVKSLKMDAVGLTEHGNINSFLQFYKKAKENNINPIIGCEFYQNDLYFDKREEFLESNKKKKSKKSEIESEDSSNNEDDEYSTNDNNNDYKNNHFLSYATNYEGLKNIIQLSNMANFNFYRKPLIHTNMIFDKLNKNNIITTGCIKSKFNSLILNEDWESFEKLIKKFKNTFEDNFYLEIQLNNLKIQNKVNEVYKKYSKKYNIKPVFALDYHYANKDDWYIQYLLYVIKSRSSINTMTSNDWFYSVRDLYIKDIDEIYKIANDQNFDIDFLDEAIDSTFEIKDKTNIEIEFYKNNYPKFSIDSKESNKILRLLLKEKLREKIELGLIPDDKFEIYKNRIKYELETIEKRGFVDYFLIIHDIVENFVKKSSGTTGVGRGSAGGSLILFILDVTKIDPIKYDLIWERFINPGRLDPPDIDLDVSSDVHSQVEEYLKQKYGEDKVCHIANFSRFGIKSTLKDLCRIFELDYGLSNRLNSYMNFKEETTMSNAIDVAIKIAKEKSDNEILKFIDENKKIFIDYGEKFLSMIRQLSRHASGILISNNTFDKSEMPIYKLKGEIITGISEGNEGREVSELGYLKLDILGLTTATINNKTIQLIEKNHNIKNIENELIKSGFNDQKVFKEFHKGNCRDIFQFGTHQMINLMKRIKPKTINDLSAVNALFRPATIGAGGIEEFIDNKNNLEKVKNDIDKVHKDLWDIIKETNGVMVYQEQIMQIFSKLGGFTMAEADEIRKAQKEAKAGKNPGKYNKALKKFKLAAIKNGASKELLDTFIEKMESYAKYSFNFSHSLCYSVNSYISMWLKVYYPIEYYSILINFSNSDDIPIFIKQAKNSGIEFTKCLYGEASNRFEVDYKNNKIKFGLNVAKGIRKEDINSFINNSSLNKFELISFIISNKINKKTIEVLSRLGFFSKIIHENNNFVEKMLLHLRNCKSNLLDENIEKSMKLSDKFKTYTKTEKIKFQKEYLGFFISEHPFITITNSLIKNNNINLDKFIKPKDIGNYESNNNYNSLNVIGIVSNIILMKGKKSNREYYKIVVEDDESQTQITIFDLADVKNIKIGDFIIINCNLSDFGLTKNRGQSIRIYKNQENESLSEKTLDNFDTIILNKKSLESFSLF